MPLSVFALALDYDIDDDSNVCDEIIHVNNQELHYYKGTYDTFKKMQKQKTKQVTTQKLKSI